MNKKIRILFGMLLLSWLCLSLPAVAEDGLGEGEYYTLISENGAAILLTGFPVSVGDIYIAADNTRYIVDRIEGLTIHCKKDGIEPMPEIGPEVLQSSIIAGMTDIFEVAEAKPKVAIYHTHSDESYVPSDGTESIKGEGGIYDVNAYNRSRKTAAELIRDGADMIIDVHRDAVPAEVYKTEVKGEEVTKVKMVVGRSNPGMSNNLEFAKTIKAAMDKVEPGLSAGIYMGKGDYNQDLSPRAILIEVGAHTNSKEEAEKGVKRFAAALPAALGITAQKASAAEEPVTGVDNQAADNNAQKKPLQKTSGPWVSIIIILAVVGLGLVGFHWINNPKR